MYTEPQIIIKAFAEDGDYSLPPASASTTIANQETGYPERQSQPLDSNGLPVNREQTNGVFNLYSQHILWQQNGGQYTFEEDVATAGGYKIDAILWCESNKSYQRSLVDNNVANFVTNPEYINDGVYWVTQSGTLAPNVETLAASSIANTSMTLNGDLIALGIESRVDAGFDYRVSGTSTWTRTALTEYESFQVYSEGISGLTENTTYEFRAVAIGLGNPGNDAFGQILTATTTNPIVPDAIINITGTTSSPTNDALNTTNIPSVTNGAVNNTTGLMTAAADNCVSSSKEYSQAGGDPDFATITTLYGISPYKLDLDVSTTSTSIVVTDAQSGLLVDDDELIVDDGGDMKIVQAGSVVETTVDDSSSPFALYNLPANGTYTTIAYGNGIYVIAKANTTNVLAATSTDGITWTDRALPISNNSFNKVYFANGYFYIGVPQGGLTSGFTYRSIDGITWTDNSSGTVGCAGGVAYNGAIFVLIAKTGNAYTSTNGTTWALSASSLGNPVNNDDATGSCLISVGTTFYYLTGGTVRTSTDGITWTSTTLPAGAATKASITYGNGIWIIGTQNGGQYRSTNGTSWTYISNAVGNAYGAAYGNGIFMLSQNGTPSTSPDGLTWTNQSIVMSGANGLLFANGLFFLVSNSSGNRKIGISAAGLEYQYTCTSLASVFGTVPLSNAPTWCAKGGQIYASSVTSVSGTTSYVTDTIASITRATDLLTIGLDNRAAPGRYARLRVTCNNADVVSRYSADLFE